MGRRGVAVGVFIAVLLGIASAWFASLQGVSEESFNVVFFRERGLDFREALGRAVWSRCLEDLCFYIVNGDYNKDLDRWVWGSGYSMIITKNGRPIDVLVHLEREISNIFGLANKIGHIYLNDTGISIQFSCEQRERCWEPRFIEVDWDAVFAGGQLLPTLAGRLITLDGETLTRELWSRMKEYSAGDPRVAGYLDWLKKALARDPTPAIAKPNQSVWRFDDSSSWVGWAGFRDPVRIGRVELPFGAALIVTAYQHRGDVYIVIHGTIVNTTEWLDLVISDLMFGDRLTEFYSPPDNLYNDVAREIRTLYTGWALFRFGLENRGGSLDINGRLVPIGGVYLLFEMPVYYMYSTHPLDYRWWIEAAYWSIVGQPAFSLALRLTSPPHTDVWDLYVYAAQLAASRAAAPYCLTGADAQTLFLIKTIGCGQCIDQVSSTTLFATNALGLASAALILPGYDHAVSLVLYPSSSRLRGPLTTFFDVDGDGVNETAIVLSDTAKLPLGTIAESAVPMGSYAATPLRWLPAQYYLTEDGRAVPGVPSDAPENVVGALVRGTRVYYWSGLVEAYSKIPDWLKPPWLKLIPRLNPETYTPMYTEFFKHWWGPRSASPSLDPEKVAEAALKRVWFINPLTDPRPPEHWRKVFTILINETLPPKALEPPSHPHLPTL